MSPRDLRDVDVLIPLRIDSADRRENLDAVLTYFDEAFVGHRVWVLEHAATSAAADVARAHGAEHHFIESQGCFHKSRVFNLGVALADRPYVLLHDCDVLLPAAALVAARRRLASGEDDFVYPYNGLLLQVARARLQAAASPGALVQMLPEVVPDRGHPLPAGVELLHGSRAEPSAGAALMAVRRKLVLAGGYNENIVSYGCEDTELATRLQVLGERVAWLPDFSAYHVSHRRGPDSRYNNFHGANLAEWRKVAAMDRPTLAAYVRNGFRSLHLDSRATLVVEDSAEAFALRLERGRGADLSDVAFVLPIAHSPATVRRLAEDFLTRLDGTFDNYEFQLVEIGGYELQASAHRDHVLHVHADAGSDWLADALARTTRAVVCLCSPLTDVAPAPLLAALADARASAGTPARLAAAIPAGLMPSAHADKLGAAMLRMLPIRGDAVLATRAALAAAAPFAYLDGCLDLDALARRLET